MGTPELTFRDMHHLVAEAYAAFYLKGWIIRRAKEYLNPFGKFNWMFSCLGRLAKQGIVGGLGMLYSQGITTKVISDELKNKKELMKDINIPYKKFAPIKSQKDNKIKLLTTDKIGEVSEQT